MDIGPVLFSTFTLTFLALYPFYLRKYKPHRYRGLWIMLGDLNKTPENALVFPSLWLTGNLLYLYLFGN